MISLPDFEKKQWLVVFSKNGEKVSFKNDNIVIINQDGKTIHQSTCYRLFSLMIVGPATLTSGIIEKSKKFGFSIILLSYNMRVYEALLPENRGNVLLREKQYSKPDFSIAQHLIINKIENQISLMKQERKKSESTSSAIDSLTLYCKKIKELKNDESLLGFEGMSSRLFFKNYFRSMSWKRRSPRTKEDIPNLLLDIGYTYLFNFIETLLVLYGFDVYKGVYHQTFYQRKSLVCDLIEPFRCMIDHSLKKAYNLKRISLDDFTLQSNQFRLNYQNSQKYVEMFVEEIRKNRLEIFKYIQSYYRSFMKDKSGWDFPKFELNKTI